MFSDVPTISPQMKVSEASDRVIGRSGSCAASTRCRLWMSTAELAGMVTQSDLLAMLELEGGRDKTVLEAGTARRRLLSR